MAERVLDANTFPAALAEVVVGWPLYRRFKFVGDVSVVTIGSGRGKTPCVTLPEEAARYCERCKTVQRWRLVKPRTNFGYAQIPIIEEEEDEEIRALRFDCKNCESVLMVFLKIDINPGRVSEVVKVGQYPALELEPSPILASAMTKENLILYRHALTCRNSNFGIAAVAYLRRIVEDRLNYVLDLIATAPENEADPEGLKRLSEVKMDKRFSEKIDYAARILPTRLRLGGHNPIATLHDLASEALHAKSDEDCVEIFDSCKLAVEYVVKRLKEDHDEDAAYQNAMKVLAAKKTGRKT